MSDEQRWADDGGMCGDPVGPRTLGALIEALAAIEHERWGDWQKWVHRCCRESDGYEELDFPGLLMPAERVEHWERLIATPYVDLPEYSKQSDRDQVMRYLPLIVDFVAAWLGDTRILSLGSEGFQFMTERAADKWRADMGAVATKDAL